MSHRYSCASASGTGDHYYDDASSSDPWTTTYTSDSSGSATVNLTMPGFTMRGAIPVAYHTLVVHTTTAKAGCGLVGTPTTAFAFIGGYPGYSGNLIVSGSAYVTDSDDGIYVEATLYGLEPSTTAGFHIHAGFSCLEAEDVGAHFFDSTSDDPWSTTYTSDEYGRASVSMFMSGFSLADELPVSGRTVVVHSSTSKVGCGLLEPTVGEVVSVGHYPGFSGSEQVNGTVLVAPSWPDGSGVVILGTLIGVEPDVTAGIHIHDGRVGEMSCASRRVV